MPPNTGSLWESKIMAELLPTRLQFWRSFGVWTPLTRALISTSPISTPSPMKINIPKSRPAFLLRHTRTSAKYFPKPSDPLTSTDLGYYSQEAETKATCQQNTQAKKVL